MARNSVPCTTTSSFATQLQNYLAEPFLDDDSDCLVSWQLKQGDYPQLSDHACKYLPPPASYDRLHCRQDFPTGALQSVRYKIQRPYVRALQQELCVISRRTIMGRLYFIQILYSFNMVVRPGDCCDFVHESQVIDH